MSEMDIFLFKAPTKHTQLEEFKLTEKISLSVNENDFVFIQIVSLNRLDKTTTIWLADYQFDLILDGFYQSKYYYRLASDSIFSSADIEKFSRHFLINGTPKLFTKLFLNYYGTCELEVENASEEEKTFTKVCSIEIVSGKIEDISLLLEYLFEKDFFFWNVISLSKSPAAEVDKLTENVLWKLLSVDRYTKHFFEYFLDRVSYDKFYKLDPESKIKAWTLDDTLTENSILWLLENSNQLVTASVYDEQHFLIKNRPYKAETISAEFLSSNTDVNENHIIHWFISDLFAFLSRTKEIFDSKITTIRDVNVSFKGKIYERYFKRLLYFIQSLTNELITIKSKLDEDIPVTSIEKVTFNDQRLQSKPHYYKIYQNILSWIDDRQVNFSPDLLFAGIKDVSKLYEIYCLFKIVDTLLNDLHFTQTKSNDRIDLFQNFTSESLLSLSNLIPEVYSFVNKDYSLNLYYEKLPDALITITRTGRGLRPDFVMEIINKNSGEISYLILDAKYMKLENIERYEYPDLALKYMHGIGLRRGGKFNIIGLMVLNPIENSGIRFYQSQNFDLFGPYKNFPLIGRLEISVDRRQLNHLHRFLSKLLSTMK